MFIQDGKTKKIQNIFKTKTRGWPYDVSPKLNVKTGMTMKILKNYLQLIKLDN